MVNYLINNSLHIHKYEDKTSALYTASNQNLAFLAFRYATRLASSIKNSSYAFRTSGVQIEQY